MTNRLQTWIIRKRIWGHAHRGGFNKHAKLYYDSTGYAHDFAEFRTEVILNKEKGKYYPKVTKTKTGLTYVIIVEKRERRYGE